jgi:hypothetical protein
MVKKTAAQAEKEKNRCSAGVRYAIKRYTIEERRRERRTLPCFVITVFQNSTSSRYGNITA